METEIKLGFADKESLYGVIGSDWFTEYCTDGTSGVSYILENSYRDTKDMKVSSRGGMVRVRHYAGGDDDFYEFTVKYGGGVEGGLHKRYEWNVKSETGVFAIGEFKKNAADEDPVELLDELLEGISDTDLLELCRNSFRRTFLELRYGVSTMEACIDYGTIEDSEGQVREYICELELELVSGDVSDVQAMSEVIMANASCKPFDDTKYHRTIRYISKG